MIGCCLKNKANVLMRIFICKIHCPSFICFCKPSPHIYTAGPLKLENRPHVPSTTFVSANEDDNAYDDIMGHVAGDGGESSEVQKESVLNGKQKEQQGGGDFTKSSLRKADSDSNEVQKMKKKVQWLDFLGKELVEIKEFEPSEVEDISYDGRRSCVCVIL